MEEMKNAQVNMCNFMDVKPIMMDLPYPPIQVKEKKSVLCPSVKHRVIVAPYRKCLQSRSTLITKTVWQVKNVPWQKQFLELQWQK